MQISIVEKHLESKSGHIKDCEDAIFTNNHFIAVIDGATAKSDSPLNYRTPGRIAAKIIVDAFRKIPVKCTARQAANTLTQAVRKHYKTHYVLNAVKKQPQLRISASLIAFSPHRWEVWLIGDCQGIIGKRMIRNPLAIDRKLAAKRAQSIKTWLKKGTSIEQLRRRDLGRESIAAELMAQANYQNNPSSGRYWYPVINGFRIPPEGIIVKKIPPNVDTLVLASDGYPSLKPSLKESEESLREILRKDPLCFKLFKSTKGCMVENISFDDRAYIKIRIPIARTLKEKSNTNCEKRGRCNRSKIAINKSRRRRKEK